MKKLLGNNLQMVVPDEKLNSTVEMSKKNLNNLTNNFRTISTGLTH